MSALSDRERAVLEYYRKQDDKDPESAFAPYHHEIVAVASSDPHLAYAICKRLKSLGLLACNGRQSTLLARAPAYWITDKGREAL